jgi:hypothetical protein
VKFQAIADSKGRIIWYSGPHLGKTHDISIFYQYLPPFEVHERVLADKGYCGERAKNLGCIAPFKRNRARRNTDSGDLERVPLTRRQLTFNSLLSYYRIEVEHAFGYLKRFHIVGHKYRGSLKGTCRLSKAMKILLNFEYLCA